MKITKKVQKTIEELDDIKCNKCGKSCLNYPDMINTVRTADYEFATLQAQWGYWSNKDDEAHESHLCEKCYDEIIATFKIPPTVIPIIYIG